jgi:hypothetical protein
VVAVSQMVQLLSPLSIQLAPFETTQCRQRFGVTGSSPKRTTLVFSFHRRGHTLARINVPRLPALRHICRLLSLAVGRVILIGVTLQFVPKAFL